MPKKIPQKVHVLICNTPVPRRAVGGSLSREGITRILRLDYEDLGQGPMVDEGKDRYTSGKVVWQVITFKDLNKMKNLGNLVSQMGQPFQIVP